MKAASLPFGWALPTLLGGGPGRAESSRQQRLPWPVVASSLKLPHQERDHSPVPILWLLLCPVGGTGGASHLAHVHWPGRQRHSGHSAQGVLRSAHSLLPVSPSDRPLLHPCTLQPVLLPFLLSVSPKLSRVTQALPTDQAQCLWLFQYSGFSFLGSRSATGKPFG